MKAKIKANGEIVNIIKEDVDFVCADNGYIYKFDDIEILSHSIVENNAWSEEDDTFLRAIVRDIENVPYINETAKGERIKWLKSLKDRVQHKWKPSEAQLIALDEVFYKTNCANNACRRIIFNLLNDLKKLTHE